MSAAYPGTACISGWHSACATTFGYRGQTYSQVWCCPAGEYECVGTDARLSSTVRQCASSVLNPSQYGLTFGLWDTNIGDYSSKTVTTKVFPTVPAGQGWQYRIDAMPLRIPPKTTSLPPLTTEPGSVTVYLSPEETSASAASGTPHHLSKGSIAGIVCGSVAAALMLAAMFFVCARRRRRMTHQVPETAVVGQDVDSYYGKPELPTVDAVRAEMDGHAVYHEMDGKSLPAEALSPHTIPDEQARTGVETEAKPSDGVVQELPGVAMGR
ncbi:hypothetical protein PG985_016088 [Apiospora marii]|uniref:uncharacterized protein n=1 Tax=Apiospora marii TaxID=335849 RepID=UPI0031301FC6